MIYKTIKIKVRLKNTIIKIKPSISKNIHLKARLAVNVAHYSPDIDLYSGEYEVTPTFEQNELDTKNKLLTEDVVVHKIPVSFTQNLSGGNTVYIGG